MVGRRIALASTGVLARYIPTLLHSWAVYKRKDERTQKSGGIQLLYYVFKYFLAYTMLLL